METKIYNLTELEKQLGVGVYRCEGWYWPGGDNWFAGEIPNMPKVFTFSSSWHKSDCRIYCIAAWPPQRDEKGCSSWSFCTAHPDTESRKKKYMYQVVNPVKLTPEEILEAYLTNEEKDV